MSISKKMTGKYARDRMLKMLRASECTLLGITPASQNCIDVILELAHQLDLPLMLYVNPEQIEYVMTKDNHSNIVLCGAAPASGVEIVRLDTSSTESFEEKMRVLLELYESSHAAAAKAGREVLFDIGIDAPTHGFQDIPRFHEMLDRVFSHCKKNRLPTPTFVTAQTGTKVTEMRNTGSLSRLLEKSRRPVPPPPLTEALKLCDSYGIGLRANDADFLSDEVLEWFPRLGIHAATIGSELAIAEKRTLERLSQNGKPRPSADRTSIDDAIKADLRRAILRCLYAFNLVTHRAVKAA